MLAVNLSIIKTVNLNVSLSLYVLSG